MQPLADMIYLYIPSMSGKQPNVISFYSLDFSIFTILLEFALVTFLISGWCAWSAHGWCEWSRFSRSSLSLIVLLIQVSIVFNRNNVRLIGQNYFGSKSRCLSDLGMNETLTFLHASDMLSTHS